ncbi:MAG TPA: phytoene/squalene synthase family protein [Clostridia bacterium]|nr:phytoene/squalene synthase family protein [Clostridia bacterium]
MPASDPQVDLLTTLLRDVSRSFYLTLRVLPGAIRRQMGLAYLLARTTDTVADTELVPLDIRLETLRRLRESILGETGEKLDLHELARNQGTPAEQVLLGRVEASLSLLDTLSPGDLARVRAVLETIISGQTLDLERFRRAGPTNVVSLDEAQELDDYTYRVAGCVGEFWTKMCRAHLFAQASIDEAWLLTSGVRFGKGLQLVNILRDLPRDLRQGRCYIPSATLKAASLKPADLLDPRNEPQFRPVYNCLLEVAEAHLKTGWAYTNALPSGNARVRLACAWPILIGLKTIARLRAGRVLDPAQKIKVTRREVRNLVLRSLVLYPIHPLWRRMVQ